MTNCALILRNGTVVTPDGVQQADIGVADGKIVALGTPSGAAREVVDANGLHIFPGLIDAHVHFNDPGRAHWEGIETGSRALAAGGGTMFFDMPLNSSPPTLDAASFDAKLAVAQKTSLTDFALWGGLTPGNVDKLEELAERGVIGFKAFMSNSGIEDFSSVDDATLKAGMKRAARLGKLVAVHAESDAITRELSQLALAQNKTSVRDYLDSRPVRAELDAIQRAIALAAETGCALHIVHVSCGAGVGFVVAARAQGVNVTCETCPHYLTLSEGDVEKLGAVAKCAPPLRTKLAQDALWRYVAGGAVSTIGSDHSPSPPDLKRDKNFFKVWGGISGVQHTLPLLITEGNVNREVALQSVARLTSFNVAERFNLPPAKGRIVAGADADFALVDLKQKFTVRAEDLFYRHKHSPYVGRALTGRVVRTILRGQTIFRDGKIVSPPVGRLVKPQP
ncbi:MAG: allantoinase [Verrucomicrobia bacterium]|nr:MAG: allantoinase [Verrucomicrobiota bacterium]